MHRIDVHAGDRLYAVARTASAPAICYQSPAAQVTVTRFGLGDLVYVDDVAGRPHAIYPADLSRTLPRPIARKPRPMSAATRSMAGFTADGPVTYEESPLF